MTTIINSGDGPERLLALLAETPLDPTFEAYGNFISPELYHAKWDIDARGWADDTTRPIYPDTPGMHRFFGNFWHVSGVFSIDTNDQALIDQLTTAIRANQQTPAYLAAKQAIEARTTKKESTPWHQ